MNGYSRSCTGCEHFHKKMDRRDINFCELELDDILKNSAITGKMEKLTEMSREQIAIGCREWSDKNKTK